MAKPAGNPESSRTRDSNCCIPEGADSQPWDEMEELEKAGCSEGQPEEEEAKPQPQPLQAQEPPQPGVLQRGTNRT